MRYLLHLRSIDGELSPFSDRSVTMQKLSNTIISQLDDSNLLGEQLCKHFSQVAMIPSCAL